MTPQQNKKSLKTPQRYEVEDYFEAATQNMPKVIAAFLDKYPDFVDLRHRDNATALMWAAGNGYNDVVRLLLERGADPNATSDMAGYTALMCAATRGKKETMEILLEHGANAGLANKFNCTAEKIAREYNYTDAVEVLRKWPEMQEQRQRIEREAKELAVEIADFSPALKKDMRAPRPIKRYKKGISACP